jgi:hypothetical protein
VDLLRNVTTGIIHRVPDKGGCRAINVRGMTVPWLLAAQLDEVGVMRLSEEHDIHLCRCLLPVRCRCHKCAPVESRP